MSSSDTHVRPLVLVVEDDPVSLETRSELLSQHGCTPIPVRNADEALRELRASPGPDLLLTDIHLNTPPEDRSGLELARAVKRLRSDLPLAGYSAYFAEDEVAEAKHIFDRYWARGMQTIPEIEASIEVCRELALEHRRRRSERAADQLELLRRKYETDEPEVELLRELIPAERDSARIEEALRQAGYRLALVDANTDGLRQPIIVWLLEVDDHVEAEAYTQPSLYADGATTDEAIASLVELMQLYAAELAEDDGPAGDGVLGLKVFLDRVIGPARN